MLIYYHTKRSEKCHREVFDLFRMMIIVSNIGFLMTKSCVKGLLFRSYEWFSACMSKVSKVVKKNTLVAQDNFGV